MVLGLLAAHTTGIHYHCTNFNKTYPHGVGRKTAVDKTSGTKVTTFKKSNKIYNTAVSHNSDLDHRRRQDRLREGLNDRAGVQLTQQSTLQRWRSRALSAVPPSLCATLRTCPTLLLVVS